MASAWLLVTSVAGQVLARGPEAVQAFLSAQRQGTLPLYTARLSVVGQQG